MPDGTRIAAIARLAEAAGAKHLAEEARLFDERLGHGLFHVACVGQFKRGKSSLLNALIGDPVLPVGIVPVTAVVTIVRHGPSRRARVRRGDGSWLEIAPEELADYVSEERNPGNRLGVAVAEVLVPSALLATGMCLVDTPGLGSVFTGNTEATHAFVPQIDAGLVVLGAEPPLSADELSLVKDLAGQCGDLLFVLNKADRLGDAERAEACAFTRRVLAERAGLAAVRLFEVSAKERLVGTGPPRGWPELTRALEDLARRSGADLVRAAEERGALLLADHLRRFLEEERGALARPLEESERRVAALRACVTEAERSLHDLDYLFQAEQERLARTFAEQREAFLKRATPGAMQEFSGELREIAVPAVKLRGRAIALAAEVARRWLDRWLEETGPTAEAMYIEGSRRFVDLANGFLARLADSADGALAGLPRVVEPEKGFRVRSGFYHTSLMNLTGQTPLGFLLDLLGPRRWRLEAIERDIGQYLEQVLIANANRIANALDDRVLESRRRLQAELRSHLHGVSQAAEQALARARARQAAGREAVEADLGMIGSLLRELSEVQRNPEAMAP